MSNVLVLVHAFPVGARMWADVAVPPGWAPVYPSLPGFDGVPPPPAESSRIDDYASAVLAQLDSDGIDRFVVGGTSMGGYVSFAIWRLAAERCRGLILIDTRAGADSEAGRANRDRMLGTVATGGPHAIADEMLPKLLGQTTRRDHPDVEARVRRWIESQPPAGIAGAIARMRDRPDSMPMLSSITVPTLVVVGEEDELTPPAESEAMHGALPNASLVRIPRAGHLSPLERPDAFSEALTEYLNRL